MLPRPQSISDVHARAAALSAACLPSGGATPTLRLGGRAMPLGGKGGPCPIASMRQIQAPKCPPEVAFQIVLETSTGTVIIGAPSSPFPSLLPYLFPGAPCVSCVSLSSDHAFRVLCEWSGMESTTTLAKWVTALSVALDGCGAALPKAGTGPAVDDSWNPAVTYGLGEGLGRRFFQACAALFSIPTLT